MVSIACTTSPGTVGHMRLLIATCSATYTGRSTAELPAATRLVLLRADGGVLLLAETGQVKPLMWMPAPCTRTEDGDTLRVVHDKTGERLDIRLHEVHADVDHDLGIEPGLRRDDTEAHLQRLVMDNPTVLGVGFTVVQKEAPTPIGPVDFLCRDGDGLVVAVEAKRRVDDLAPVEQVTRYVEFLNRDPALGEVSGMLVATSFAPQAKVLAADRGIRCVTVDLDELRGRDPDVLTLF